MTIEIPDECEDWIAWLVNAFEELDCSAPALEGFLVVDREWPDWVTRMVRELISTLLPAAKLNVGAKWTPAELGAVIGQRIAYFQRLGEPKPWPGLDVEKSWEGMKEEERATAERLAASFGDHMNAVYDLTAVALVLALDQSHAESSAFMSAYARGLAMKPSDMFASNFERTTTRIYWFLLRYWPSIPKLGSVRRLHQVLCLHFETFVVGDQKRIEKLCQRIGLSFGRPGRPAKVKKNTDMV